MQSNGQRCGYIRGALKRLNLNTQLTKEGFTMHNLLFKAALQNYQNMFNTYKNT